ncbi:MAG TPA: anthrone oxygenase family protein [Streptomyces sp.]|uniref:anthrone oxygenase family protein n=1 Tax=Streptomyces sp. TaxID=1931 RepID=UPI002CBFD7C3|nr:anthrone oxygenase family protein [Streptomyces sp.]HWU11358.1 anthrone oxygenase family protein [Streptomyces sp.]
MRTLQTATLLASTAGAALMAGLFCAFAYAVMPGLSRTGDREFVRSMRHINRAVINGWFLVPFLLPLPSLVLATVLAAKGHSPGALPWIIAALVLYGAAFLVTGTLNVPLNDALDKVPPDAASDRLKEARAAFEGRWVRWNTVRAVLHTASFGALLWAFHLHGTAAQG